jgi:hypothetical protein
MSRTSGVVLGALLLSGLVARDAAAQWNVARLGEQANRVYATFGLDPAFVGTTGYGRVIRLYGHAFQLTGDLGLATAQLDTRDFRARVGAQTSLLRWRSLHLVGSATFITRGTQNQVYKALDFGADFTGTLGLYRRGWFVAGEFGKDKAIITHVTNSDWYKRYYYPDAKDGWYLDAGGTFHYGLAAGLALGAVEVAGRFGWLRTETWDQMTPPYYATVGLGIGF